MFRHEQKPPDASNSIMNAMKRSGFNKMADLLERTGLAANLSTPGPFTGKRYT